MREPSIQKTTLISFALHMTAFLIVFIFLRQSNHLIMPSPYTVSLVGPDVLTGIDRGKNTGVEKIKKAAAPSEAAAPYEVSKKSSKEKAKEKERIEEKISAMAAKKKIERLAGLRSMISLKAGSIKGSGPSQAASSYQGRGATFDDYYARITKEIWQHWIYPDVGRKDIEAVISVRILKDGTAIVQKVEKGSGNSLFDRSAVKAITKASPLPPPPYEMEIGVRFYP